MTTILITGGAGFIGHHFAEHVFRSTDWNIVIIDKLSYSSHGLQRLENSNILHNPRTKVFTTDLTVPLSDGIISEIGDVDYIVHLAAETHVDNSIDHPIPFIRNNIDSTVNILEYARTLKTLKKFLYFSTDEVYGPAPDNVSYREWDRYKPTNPYSGSKAASEMICMGYENTYKIPLIICNIMNVFGERQHVEKFIPKAIKTILEDGVLDIHTDKDMKSGSRFYIHGRNVASAICFLLDNGEIGEKYNITGEKEVSNMEMAQIIADVIGKPLKYRLDNDCAYRPGHDLRYALDGSKLHSLGWNLPKTFEESLIKTIRWTIENPQWLEY
jgi:dTDP-glucose 4,6-dehydratase